MLWRTRVGGRGVMRSVDSLAWWVGLPGVVGRLRLEVRFELRLEDIVKVCVVCEVAPPGWSPSRLLF